MQPWDLAIRVMFLLRRWWILVLISGLSSGATAAYLLKNQPSQYVSTITLMVGNNLRSANPPDGVAGVGMTLAAFYAEMAKRTPITEPVVERLKLPFPAAVLNGGMVSTRVVQQAQLIEISVVDTDPQRAKQIADAVAQELINFSPSAPDKVEATRPFIQAQLKELEAKIKDIEERIRQLNVKIHELSSAGEIADANKRLQEFQAIKATDQASYQALLNTLNESSVNSLEVLEPAQVPTSALPQRKTPAIGLAALLGLIIGFAAAWILDELDDVWRRGRKPEAALGEPTLGSVPVDGYGLSSAASLRTPRGQVCMALRSELLLQLPQAAPPSLIVTSARTTAERSRLAIDLARLFARSGQAVLLVDANLGNSFTSRALGVEGDGLQKVLRDPDHEVAELIQQTDEDKLAVLPGSAEGLDAQLVPALHWPRALHAVSQSAELTIIDGPSVLESADATLLAPHVGGIVLVIDPASESCSDTRRALARLREHDAPLLGIIMLSYPRQSLWRVLRGQQYQPRPAPMAG